jgi:hypothetical protein
MEWLTRFSSETSSKCSGIDPDGLWSIYAKEKPGRRHHLTCLEVDQLLERTTSLIPGILQELGVADPGLGGYIEVGYGYVPAMVAVPEEHAPPDGRDRRAFGIWALGGREVQIGPRCGPFIKKAQFLSSWLVRRGSARDHHGYGRV